MTDTNLNEALETHIATVREALEVNLALWRDDVEPGDFDRDVIEPTQRALAALDTLRTRLEEAEKERHWDGMERISCEERDEQIIALAFENARLLVAVSDHLRAWDTNDGDENQWADVVDQTRARLRKALRTE